MKRVLVTGAGGYVGAVLCKELLAHGYAVTAVDRFFFGQETLREIAGDSRLTIVKKDIRDSDASDFAGVFAVCDLAALSNDPCGELNPQLTDDINHSGRVRVAETDLRGHERHPAPRHQPRAPGGIGQGSSGPPCR